MQAALCKSHRWKAVTVTLVGNTKRFPLLGQKEQPLNSAPLDALKVQHTLNLDISFQ